MSAKGNLIERKFWTLLVIAAAGGRSLTPVQLQKTLFLLGQERKDDVGNTFYDFIPYDYGPFSQAIYRDAEELDSDDLISILWGGNGRWREYAATPLGLAEAEKLRKKIEPDTVGKIDELVGWARSLSFQELVREVYRRYPAFRANSVFKD